MPARTSNLRRNIATVAARLIAEEGIADFALAKRKAARQLGVGENEAMPTNGEIEEALRTHQILFHDDDHDDRLRAMRETAVDVMRLLSPFRTYLTGMALDGTASAFSEVELEVYADSAKDVEIYLLGEGLEPEHREVRRNGPDSPEAILVFDYDEVPVKLRVFDPVVERSGRRSGGKPVERARIEAVQALLAAATTDDSDLE
ncbi:hypothetical protein [Uliginosibacterium sp. H1]|uniref:hypothetical protein n=1 Tax=Uliginosibacterium sp. H1 TaxID=3114757 RepID=UPI002E186A9E|nr:hypothetical protein [Uliginosibacterium sp. H1]